MTDDIENSMRKPYIEYDYASALAAVSAEDIEKAFKEREKLQSVHGLLTPEQKDAYIKRFYEIEQGIV